MNVSFLYFGKIPQLNGAAVFFNSLIENKMAFEASLGVSVSFYYQRTIESSNSNKPSAGSRFSLKKMLNYFLPKTLIGSLLYFFIFYQRNAKRVIKSFMAKRISDDTETLILNDIFVGIECLKNKCIDLSKSVLILHNDGNPLQMIEEGLPKIKSYKKIKYDVNTLIDSVSRIVLLSEKAKDNFITAFPNQASKAVVINNGVKLNDTLEINPYKIPHDRIFCICVGTVSYRKGHDLLIKAMNNLSEAETNKIVVFCLGNIGDDVDITTCPPNLIFLKGVEHNLLSTYLKNADLFLMCSRDEGVPLSILEAMQFGLPIFSTNVGGIPDIVSSNGTLFEPTEEAIRRAIQEITEGVYDLNDMSGKSLQLYAEKYSLDFMVEKYISVIKAIVNE